MAGKPQLVSIKLEKLHPTQITVGKREVAHKRREWAELGRRGRTEALANHWFPAVIGPGGKHYIVDHHHFGLALLEEGVRRVSLLILKDLSWLTLRSFWHTMDHHQWVHPYDKHGERQPFSAVPKHLVRLQDDPYRSLAGELRKLGGYAKEVQPFSEFLWADFLRRRVNFELVKHEYHRAVERSLKLARSDEAQYLPGWTGVLSGT